MSANTDALLGFTGSTYGTRVINNAMRAALPRFRLPSDYSPTLDPYSIRFSQSSIRNSFKNGVTIDELATSLKIGRTTINNVSPIRLMARNNVLYTLDNRRLEAFRRAGIEVPYRMATSEEIASEVWKFSSKNGGISIRIRGNK